MALLTTLGAFLRFYRLDAIPPGFHFDQAFYVFDALRLLEGEFAIFFAAPGGSEPLYPYLATVGVSVLGVSAIALKVTSAVIGLLIPPVLYGFTRAFLGSRFAAAVASVLATISVWMIFYSRNGERIGLETLMALLAFWLSWRALNHPDLKSFAYAGAVLGIALYTYPAVRIVPLILLVVTLYFIWVERLHARQFIKGLGVTLGIGALVFLPLGVYYVFHPDDFFAHTVQVSVLSPTAGDTSVAQTVLDNALRILNMFVIQGDGGLIRNVPKRPVFDPFLAPLFMIGVAVWVYHLRPTGSDTARRNQKRSVFLLVWLALALGVSLISDDAPNFGRINQAAPAIFVLAAWGADGILGRLKTTSLRRVGVGVLALMLTASGVLAIRDYFLDFGSLPAVYYAYDADKVEITDWIEREIADNRIFLAPLYYQQGTISLLTRTLPLDTFESRDTIVLPGASGGKGAYYAFPPEQDKKLGTLASRLGTLGQTDELLGTLGPKLLGLYHVPVERLPGHDDPLRALQAGGPFLQPHQTTSVKWSDNFELLGYTVEAGDAAQRNLSVTLFLRATGLLTTDYTFSIKAADDKGRVWGQEDKWTGNNSYSTLQWKPDDIIVERFYPGLAACAPAGNYHLTVEAYDPKTNHVLALSGQAGTQFALGEKPIQASRGNRLEDLEPDTPLDARVYPTMSLIGYTLAPETPSRGQPFSLSLFWKGLSGGSLPVSAQIHLIDSTGNDRTLAASELMPPPANRGLCSLYDLQLPENAAPGVGSIFVNDTKILDIEIVR